MVGFVNGVTGEQHRTPALGVILWVAQRGTRQQFSDESRGVLWGSIVGIGCLDDDWFGSSPGGGASRAAKDLQMELINAADAFVPEDKVRHIFFLHPEECHGPSDASWLEVGLVAEEVLAQGLHAALLEIVIGASGEVGHKESRAVQIDLRTPGEMGVVAKEWRFFAQRKSDRFRWDCQKKGIGGHCICHGALLIAVHVKYKGRREAIQRNSPHAYSYYGREDS